MDLERSPGPARAEPDWQDMVRREIPALSRWVRRLSGGHEAADVAQEAMLRLLEAGPERVGLPRAWLFRAAHKVALDRARRRKVRQAAAQSLASLARARPPRTPEEEVLAASDLERLASALRRLPDARREVLLRVRLGGEPTTALARQHGVSTRTVERWVEQAADHCRAWLRPGADELAA